MFDLLKATLSVTIKVVVKKIAHKGYFTFTTLSLLLIDADGEYKKDYHTCPFYVNARQAPLRLYNYNNITNTKMKAPRRVP